MPRTLDQDDADWDRVLAVNVRGVLLCGREAARHMVAGGGAIVSVASTLGLVAHPRYGIYGAAKAAVISLTRSMAVE